MDRFWDGLLPEAGLEKGSTWKQVSKWFLPESEVVLPGLFLSQSVLCRGLCQVGDVEDLGTTWAVPSHALRKMLGLLE